MAVNNYLNNQVSVDGDLLLLTLTWIVALVMSVSTVILFMEAVVVWRDPTGMRHRFSSVWPGQIVDELSKLSAVATAGALFGSLVLWLGALNGRVILGTNGLGPTVLDLLLAVSIVGLLASGYLISSINLFGRPRWAVPPAYRKRTGKVTTEEIQDGDEPRT